MDQDDPEKRIADLERQLAEPRFPLPAPASRSASTTGCYLTAEQVPNVAFSKPPIGKRGYNEAEVDAFLDHVEEQLKSQQGAAPPPPQAGPPAPMAEPQRQQAQAVGQPPQFPDAPMDAGRQPVAPGDPIRCVLFEIYSRRNAWRNALRLDFSGARPALAIEVGRDAIWVIDLTTNAPITSAALSQVTAVPKEHRHYSSGVGSIDFRGSRMPVLVVGVPGLPSLAIGPLPPGMPPDRARRYSFFTGLPAWRSSVPTTSEYPTYVVTKAEWLTLVEKFGLGPQLEVGRH
jgi:DivIVA domain-containing protein